MTELNDSPYHRQQIGNRTPRSTWYEVVNGRGCIEMHGGISILLLRGGGGMDINIYFDTTSL